jgi:protein-disulfide isomerase
LNLIRATAFVPHASTKIKVMSQTGVGKYPGCLAKDAAVDFANTPKEIWVMSSRAIIVSLILIVSARGSSRASDPATPRTQESIQQQLDELKAGQDRLFKELEEIKKLLGTTAGHDTSAGKPATPKVSTANVHGEPYRGTNTARAAIIEYSDFDCSFCGRYSRDIFPQLDREYIQTGKVRYFFRDLPEPGNTNAWFKARAARCAGDQGKFWQMHELLFSTQSATGKDLAALAQTLGMDNGAFSSCLSTEKYLANIQRSVAGAKRMGLYGTPAFLIGMVTDDGDFVRVSQVLVGANTYETLKTILDDLLADKPRAALPGQ